MKQTGICRLDSKQVRPKMICQDFQPKTHSEQSGCAKCKFFEKTKEAKDGN